MLRHEITHFVEKYVKPYTNQIEEKNEIPREIIKKMGEYGYLGINVSRKYGGQQYSFGEIEIVNEEFGKASSAVRSLLTVHGMVTMAVERWGSNECKEKYLSKLAKGELIASFCLTEPLAGSDANSITTLAIEEEKQFKVTGKKKWITMAQIADVFLVICKVRDRKTAFLIEKNNTTGILINPINDLSGMKGSAIAEIEFNECPVPKENMIGGIGFGMNQVALSSLMYGRFTIAAGCVGMAEEALKLALDYSKDRRQFGEKLYKFQLIKKMISECVIDIKAAKCLCSTVAQEIDNNTPEANINVFIAKYFCSKMVTRVVNNAIQILGANGLKKGNILEMYYRDIRVFEIIEGTSQIHEIIIANNELMKRR